jgi:hypothetical protein
MNEERLRAVRLSADAGPLRDSVLAAARRARGEQRRWRWTWAAAAVVLAVAIPVNVSLERIEIRGVRAARKPEEWPAELQHFVRLPLRSAAPSHRIPRSVEELR